jgi:hypothetical protein
MRLLPITSPNDRPTPSAMQEEHVMHERTFARQYAFGVHQYRHLLTIFYKHFCYDARFVCIGDLTKSGFSDILQRDLHTDTIIQTGVHVSYGVEEKVVRWPEHGEAHTAFFLETHSCTNKGHERPGWMSTCKADLLLYAFEVKDVGLVIYLLDFPRLKRWFEEEYLPHLPSPEYGLSVMPNENRTQGRVVKIATVVKAVPTRCFLVTFDERFHPFRQPIDMQRLRTHVLHHPLKQAQKEERGV